MVSSGVGSRTLLPYLVVLLSGGRLKAPAFHYCYAWQFQQEKMFLPISLQPTSQVESLWLDMVHELSPEPITEAMEVECSCGPPSGVGS